MANESVQNKKRMDMVEKLWHRTKPDAGTTDAEKAEAKNKIEQILSSLLKHLTFDWTSGKFVEAKQAGQPKTDAKPKQTGTTAGQWTTKELAEYLSKMFGKEFTTKTLRRYLRTMDRYNDHVTTHYSWTGQNDPSVKEIVDFLKGKVGKTA